MKDWFAIFRRLSTGGMKRCTKWSTDKDRVVVAARRSGLHSGCGCSLVTVKAEKKPKAMHVLPESQDRIPRVATAVNTAAA